jgi:hypothetical protein
VLGAHVFEFFADLDDAVEADRRDLTVRSEMLVKMRRELNGGVEAAGDDIGGRFGFEFVLGVRESGS